MSNRIDFFQPENKQLCAPSASVFIFLGGILCPFLELKEIVRVGRDEFSYAKLTYNPTAYITPGTVNLEEIETIIPIGKSICIQIFYNSATPSESIEGIPIFVGQIENINSDFTSHGENVEIVARDFGSEIQRITVYGQRVVDLGGSTKFLESSDTIFNEDGKANASTDTIDENGYSYTVFARNSFVGKFWSYAEVIYYLLCEYLPKGRLQIPSLEQLRAISENQKVSDLDITGLSLFEALNRCCNGTGLDFKFVPRLDATGPDQAIVFYKKGLGRKVELNLQQKGEQLGISKTNISQLYSKRNYWPVTHKYIGYGDFKVYEATFDLIKGWDLADEDTDYDKFSPSTNPEFYKVKDVYRKWCLNEAGDYSNSPYNQGDAFDFSKIFSSNNFIHSRRRFYPVLTTDKQGKSLGYFLQVSFDNGANWWQYFYAFNNIVDECGVWLSSDQLDVDTWVAALKGVLKFRITASVISDERLCCSIADGPVNSTAAVIDYIITLPRQFKYRKVTGKSIFANSSDPSLGTPDEVDDTDALYEHIRKKATVSSEIIETFDVQTPYLAFNFEVGDTVKCSPESRDLLSCHHDSHSISLIEKIQMDFEKQCTKLKIKRSRRLRL